MWLVLMSIVQQEQGQSGSWWAETSGVLAVRPTTHLPIALEKVGYIWRWPTNSSWMGFCGHPTKASAPLHWLGGGCLNWGGRGSFGGQFLWVTGLPTERKVAGTIIACSRCPQNLDFSWVKGLFSQVGEISVAGKGVVAVNCSLKSLSSKGIAGLADSLQALE